jgi:phosphoribosylglycinamide formyltransferase-1
LQGRLAVVPGETADELATRVQTVEHQIYPQAAGWVGSGKVTLRDEQAWVDGELAAEPVIQTY